MKPCKVFFIFLLVLTVLRLWFCSHYEIQPQEAYWYLCSTRLDSAYFDAPGGLPALVALSTKIFGASPLGIRFFMPFFALAATIIVYLISRRHLSGWLAIFPAAALNLLPVFNTASMEAGVAMPAFALGIAGIWSAWKGLELEQGSAKWWLLSGLLIAASTFIHISGAILCVSILSAILCARKFRGKFPLFWLFAIPVIGVVFILIFWNSRNDNVWLATGTFQSATEFSVRGLASAMSSALLDYTPLVCLLCLFILIVTIMHIRHHVRPRLFLALSLPSAVLWFYLGMLGISDTWLLLAPLTLMLIALAESFEKNGLWSGFLAQAAILIAAATSAWHLTHLSALPWSSVAADLQKAKIENGVEVPLFLVAPDAKTAAILSYHAIHGKNDDGKFPPVFVKESQSMESQFSLWPRYEQFVETGNAPDEFFTEVKASNPYMGRSALYVTDEAELPQTIQGAFQNVRLLETLSFEKDSRVLRVYLCENYQTMPL